MKKHLPERSRVFRGATGASGIKLSGALVPGGNVDNFKISPDSSRVVCNADQDTDEVYGLYMTSNYLFHLPWILK